MTAEEQLEVWFVRKRELQSSAAQPQLALRLDALRTWQSARLAATYRDLSADQNYAPALEFFLSDLYGAREFTARDRDLQRAWKRLQRTLPSAALAVLAQALELEVLTLELDQSVAAALPAGPVTDADYAAAYRRVGRPAARERQIELVVGIGAALERIVRRAWLSPLLRAARVPAHAAGFGALQDFLERGYHAFRHIPDPQRMLQIIAEREMRFMRTMLEGAENPPAAILAGAER